MIYRAVLLAVLSLQLFIVSPARAYSDVRGGVPSEDEAPIAILYDVGSGQILHSRNADRRFVPASITKAMTAFVAFEQIELGQLDASHIITVPVETAEEWRGKGSTMFLDAGDEVSVGLLLTGLMNVSGNDAAMVLGQHKTGDIADWLDQMNAAARRLGMTNSHFGTPNGWPDEGQTFTTARDLVRLAEALVSRHPDKYASFIGQEGLRYKNIAQSNRDPLIGRVEGADGIKTGYTNEAGHGYLGSAERNGRRLIMVVAGVSRQSVRNAAARDYIEWGFSAFDQRRLFDQAERVGHARVQGGAGRKVALVTDRIVRMNVKRRTSSKVRMTIEYDGPLRAPIQAGDRVARLRVEAAGVEPAILPLYAEHGVEQAGFFDRLLNGLIGWFA